jgi:hypothetical protein
MNNLQLLIREKAIQLLTYLGYNLWRRKKNKISKILGKKKING